MTRKPATSKSDAKTSGAKTSGTKSSGTDNGPTGAATVVAPSAGLGITAKGYWLLDASGVVSSYGTAPELETTQAAQPGTTVGLAPTPDGQGYWALSSTGAVRAVGVAQALGSVPPEHLDAPAVAINATPDGMGYWVVTASGRVVPFGAAKTFDPAPGSTPLTGTVIAQAVTPTAQGYWLLTATGDVYAFGDARVASPVTVGSGRPATITSPVAITAAPDGLGYWLTARDGTVLAYGGAQTFQPAPKQPALRGAVTGLTATPDGQGYWLVRADGRVTAYGNAPVIKPARNAKAHAITNAVALTLPVRTALGDVPMQYIALDQRAAATCPGLPWTVLAAIGKVESDFGRSTLPGVASGTNWAGAAGPMQFGIKGKAGQTFQMFDHPVRADMAPNPPDAASPPNPWDPVSAVYAGARYLCTTGGADPTTLRKAVLAYNHSDAYADMVLALAATYGGQVVGRGAAVTLAQSQLGVPYVWGGQTAGVAFDCSGLVQWVYGRMGIAVPRTSETQWAGLPHVPDGAPLAPGDLVFFAGSHGSTTSPGHVGIYIGNGMMIDAPHPGAVVRIESASMSGYIGAARP